MTINVLALSSLFPNSAEPSYGVFVLNRLRAVRGRCNVRVVAPIPVYPVLNRFGRGLSRDSHIGQRERRGDMDVDHPRFVVLPKIFKWLDALSYLVSALRIVRRIETKEGFSADVIDVHWTYPDLVTGYWLARSRGKKLIATVRGREAFYPGALSLRRLLIGYCLRRADAVVALSEELKGLTVAVGVRPERVRTILNGVDGANFTRADAAASRARLGIAPGKKVLLSVGALIERKGHHELVRALKALGRASEVDLYIIGAPGPEGDASGMLRRLISDSGLRNVHLVGKVDHHALADWYRAADVFCLATSGEGCPNVVLEALACGTPVVATDVGAIREVIADGVNGFVVTRGETDMLAAAIGRALETAWDRAHIAEVMRGKGWEQCADQVVQLYQSVLATR